MDAFINYIIGFFEFVVDRKEQILNLLLDHVQLTVVAVAIAIFIGVPIGVAISRFALLNKPVMVVVNTVQAIPSMAILGFLIPLLGIGNIPAVFMVVLYSLMPIIKNTATGILNTNKETLEAAKAIGMTEFQILTKVQFPIALPVIMAGVRISAVSAVGLMTLASVIGAGGLGYLIYSGINTVNDYMILAGAIPACLLALFMDFIFSKIEKAVTPISLRLGLALPESKDKLLELKKKRRRFLTIVSVVIVAMLMLLAFGDKFAKEEKTVTVTSKNYQEQLLMGNMISDLIEAHTDISVKRALNLGGTKIAFEAVKTGEADIQVEYTGSAYMGVLGKEISHDNELITETIKAEYAEKYGLTVFDSWGFNNQYALAVTPETKEKYNLETISDLEAVADELIFSPTFEFSNREDGMIGLQKEYDLDFEKIIPLDGALRYTAIDNEECDVIVAYTTDSLVSGFGLEFLTDDKNFFIDYYAVSIIKEETLEEFPELEEVMKILEGELTDEIMSELNYKIEIEGHSPEEISKEFLTEKGYI